MIDIIELIEKRVMNDGEERKRAVEPIGSFHSSSLGYCRRQIFLTKIHAKWFDLTVRKKMEMGSAIHGRIQYYKEIKEVYDVEVPCSYAVNGTEIVIVGSADLVAKDKSEVVDIKSIGGIGIVMQSPMREHITQLNVYMKCLNILQGSLLYVNKIDMIMVNHPIIYNDNLFDETVGKILSVYEALKKWENDGAFNNPIPFPKCGCFACNTEIIHPDIQKLIKV